MSMRYKIDLKRERIEHGYTQLRLAEHLGVSEKTISKWESGRGQPSYENMLKLCELYGKDIKEVDSVQIKQRKMLNALNATMLILNFAVLTMLLCIVISKARDCRIVLQGDINLIAYYAKYNSYDLTDVVRGNTSYMFLLLIPFISIVMALIMRKKIIVRNALLICNMAFYLIYCLYVLKTEWVSIIAIIYAILVLIVNFMNLNVQERRKMNND